MHTAISANQTFRLNIELQAHNIVKELDKVETGMYEVPVYFIGALRNGYQYPDHLKVGYDAYCEVIKHTLIQTLEFHNTPVISVLRCFIPAKYDIITNYVIHKSNELAKNINDVIPATKYLCTDEGRWLNITPVS